MFPEVKALMNYGPPRILGSSKGIEVGLCICRCETVGIWLSYKYQHLQRFLVIFDCQYMGKTLTGHIENLEGEVDGSRHGEMAG